jgi:hypothetical protein
MTGAKQSLPVSTCHAQCADWNFDNLIVMWCRRDSCARALQRCTTATEQRSTLYWTSPSHCLDRESLGSSHVIYTHWCFFDYVESCHDCCPVADSANFEKSDMHKMLPACIAVCDRSSSSSDLGGMAHCLGRLVCLYAML